MTIGEALALLKADYDNSNCFIDDTISEHYIETQKIKLLAALYNRFFDDFHFGNMDDKFKCRGQLMAYHNTPTLAIEVTTLPGYQNPYSSLSVFDNCVFDTVFVPVCEFKLKKYTSATSKRVFSMLDEMTVSCEEKVKNMEYQKFVRYVSEKFADNYQSVLNYILSIDQFLEDHYPDENSMLSSDLRQLTCESLSFAYAPSKIFAKLITDPYWREDLLKLKK